MKQKVAKVAKSSNTIHKFYCECCDYTTSRKNNYDKHLLTKKHQMFKKCFKPLKLLKK